VTSGRDAYNRIVRAAIADAARALPPSDPRAHVFFEDRSDIRITIGSSGARDVVSNRTRGATIAGRRAMHATDSEILERLRKDPAGPVSPLEAQTRDDERWLRGLEAKIVASGAESCAGRRPPIWSAKLVSFRQDVWVGIPEGEVVCDIRRGSRLELAVRVGETRSTGAVEDLVLQPDEPPVLHDAFERALERAEARASRTVRAMPGTTVAVFAPGVAGVVAHELIGHALEGDVVARGTTWISGSANPKGGAPVTVIDDPRRGRGAWAIDDEGTKTDRTVLLDRGRPVGKLLDRASADLLGVRSTGHGRRSSYLEPVRPRMGCTFVASGDDDPDEVLRSTRTGVFIRRLTGGHTDPFSGRATFIVSDADRIVDGRLAEPLDRFILEAECRESWSSIDRVAHDLAFDTCVGSCVRDGQPMVVSVGAPTIRIGVLKVRS
jgi:TldD protein